MAIVEITIKIARSEIKLNIDESKLELYRLAEQQLNASIIEFERRDSSVFGAQAPLALAAFDAVVHNILLSQHSEMDSAEVERLVALEQKVESYMNDLRVER